MSLKRARTDGEGAAAPEAEEVQRVHDIAVAAARTAGLHLKTNIGADVEKTKASQQDLVTQYDVECQKIIESYIARHCPGHHVLGEEDVAPGSEASIAATEAALAKGGWLWVIDPIDGTTNFVHAFPASVVSIGVACEGEVVIGVIYDPYRDEMFTAIKGGEAKLNGKVMHVSEDPSLAQSLVAIGMDLSPGGAKKRAPVMRALDAIGKVGARGVRDLGSAALHLAWVACGRISLYFQPDLHPWDLSAGSVLVRAAGGTVSDMATGKPYTLRTRSILAANARVHDEALATITGAKGHLLE